MGREIDISGKHVGLFYYAFTLALVLFFAVFAAAAIDSLAEVLVALPVVLLVSVWAVRRWWRASDRTGSYYLSREEGFVYDPFSNPGHAAKDTWAKAISQLPDEDEDDEQE